MLKGIYRLWLSINSSFWLITIYGIQKEWNFWIFNKILKLRTSKIDVQLEKSIVNAAKVTKSSSF